MHKNKKLYPVNGEMITIDQAAERACVSVAGIRFQLKQHGSMQAVMDYYERKNSGGTK